MRIERTCAHAEIENGVAVLSIANPPANTLSKQTRTDLLDLLGLLEQDPEVQAVILTGAGDKFFCAGADLNEEGQLHTTEEVIQFNRELDSLNHGLFYFPKPVIGAINGYAMGGGFELMLSCDFRYAALEAKMGAAGVRIGLIASADTLPRIIGPSRAKELLFTGRQTDGAEAERLGLVNRAVPRADLLDACKAVGAEIAKAAPLSVKATKQIVVETANVERKEAREMLRAHWRRLQQTEDHKEAIKAFKEKRPPVFKGR